MNGQDVAVVYALTETRRVWAKVANPVKPGRERDAAFDACGRCGHLTPASGWMGATSWTAAVSHALGHLA